MTAIRAALLLLCLAMSAWATPASLASSTSGTTTAVTRPLDLSDLAAPVFVNFSARDGLPEQVLVDVRTDREGFVWADRQRLLRDADIALYQAKGAGRNCVRISTG